LNPVNITKILANVELSMPQLELWFSWVPEHGQNQPGWKLHDIRLPEHDTDLNWFDSIAEATMRWEDTINLNVSSEAPSWQEWLTRAIAEGSGKRRCGTI
jgi:hypothetical protein